MKGKKVKKDDDISDVRKNRKKIVNGLGGLVGFCQAAQGKETAESLVRQINDKRAREFVLEFWAQYKEWLQYGGTVPIWLASIESRVRDLVESIEKEGK